ncbi:O-antigen ligase family protein [Billgrantia kenyensis]|uniref:O-antigen ligase family protein n=1 Tax=Billgrantia kenyensis TaxID=321266 RepID=A0A7W0AFD0_9GAMM|nr:O-antigen ligase family protein [Halomonas kenyensis]MBA2780236.1 O-antigen ligase family protein [Halomonas kenyensis]MCG6663108.1 O-antigen ligase family protein [Halomonas kenyensis]
MYVMRSEFLRAICGGLIFAFLSLLIVLPQAYATVPLVALVVAACGLLLGSARTPSRLRLDREDGWMLLAFLLFSGLWLLDIGRTGQWPVGEGGQGVGLPLWPLLACLLLVWFRWFPPHPLFLWWGLACGALGAGSIALYERLWLGVGRASNGMNAIPFGNLSLLLGVLSLLAVLWGIRCSFGRLNNLLFWSLLATISGLLGSLLSGTRGGWIALPMLLLLVYRASREIVSTRWRNVLLGFVAVMLVGVAMLPQSGVGHRASLAISNVTEYWHQNERGTSVGLRLEMWRGGALLIVAKPWFGWGEGGTESAIADLVEAEVLHFGVIQYDQLHSDIIDTTARRGVLGLSSLLMLYLVPICLNWRRLRSPVYTRRTRILAAAGVIVPVAFFDFGLTQSMLRDVRGLSGYLGLCVAFWAVLRAYEANVISHQSELSERCAKHGGDAGGSASAASSPRSTWSRASRRIGR